jgi:hypothetical protein
MVRQIVTKNLNMRKVCTKSIRKNLNEEYKFVLIFWGHGINKGNKIQLSEQWPPVMKLTSWSCVLVDKPPITQILEHFPTFYGTQRFIT